MAKRSYIKKSDYWEKKKVVESTASISISAPSQNSFTPRVTDFDSVASYGSEYGSRRNSAVTAAKPRKYSNIWGGMLNYEVGQDGVDARDAIELCQRAYVNVAIFRLAIDTAAELANDKVFLTGGNKKSRKLVEKWFKQIGLDKLKSQYFREYYRGGNVFFYKLWGRFSADEYKKVVSQADDPENVENKIVMRFVLLNPVDIIWFHASTFEHGAYGKVLNQYEFSALKNANTEEEKKILAALPADAKKQINSGSYPRDGIRIKLDPKNLVCSFFKKQDYEPFATPFGFPVLDDINLKIEMKKCDAAVLRSIENVILLVTHGSKDGGVSDKTLAALTEILRQPTVGRSIVSDYTTKAEFVIPDIKKVVGKEKYEVVNEDIKQGLNLVFLGDDKYGSAELKMEAFLDKLEEAQTDFINDFLQPEIDSFCSNMGLSLVPEVHFAKRTMKDESGFRKSVLRLMELGILDAKNGMEAIDNGKMPSAEEVALGQEEYTRMREKGYYNPLVGGLPAFEPPQTKEVGKKTSNKTPTKKIKEDVGRPSMAKEIGSQIDLDKLIQGAKMIDDFEKKAPEILKGHLKVDSLTEHQESFASEMASSVMECAEKKDWETVLAKCFEDKKNILTLTTLPRILSISYENQLSKRSALAISLATEV